MLALPVYKLLPASPPGPRRPRPEPWPGGRAKSGGSDGLSLTRPPPLPQRCAPKYAPDPRSLSWFVNVPPMPRKLAERKDRRSVQGADGTSTPAAWNRSASRHPRTCLSRGRIRVIRRRADAVRRWIPISEQLDHSGLEPCLRCDGGRRVLSRIRITPQGRSALPRTRRHSSPRLCLQSSRARSATGESVVEIHLTAQEAEGNRRVLRATSLLRGALLPFRSDGPLGPALMTLDRDSQRIAAVVGIGIAGPHRPDPPRWTDDFLRRRQ